MHFLLIGLLAACFTLAGTADAAAAPIAIAISAVATWISTTAVVANFLISTALSLGVGLLQQAIAKKKLKKQQQRPAGVQLEVEMGDDSPLGFTMGETATAGTRAYIGSWGSVGGTPNAYLTDVIQIGDVPAPGQPELWVDGKKVTILWNETPTDQGYPVQEYRVGSKDHLWVRYRDGTQTTADSFLLSKFGSHATRPWTSDMVGRGCPHLIITARTNRKLFTGQMQWLIEPPVTKWYDVRKDSSVGGSGDHRWDNPATWEPSSNPVVLIYNIIRGVYYGSEWVFGGQNLSAFQLPSSNWMAAANAADQTVELSGGGEEPQFRAGLEIRGDMDALQVIDELRKSCNARIAECGGIFKIQVGSPGSAVYSFTDGDILVSKGQTFEPFPNLDNTHNGIEGTYPERAEAWRTKDAPPRYFPALEEEDGERRLVTGIDFPAVPFGNQVQRLMLSMILEGRRFRQHSFFLPPDAYALEPNDMVEWTSARNGYTAKKFIVIRIVGDRATNQLVYLLEIDPSDFDWSDEYELPTTTGPIGQEPVPAQPMTGWQAFPDYLQDANEEKRRPSIRVEFASGLDDVRAVRVQVRVKANENFAFDGEIPYEELPEVSEGVAGIILNGTFLSETEYEVRGRFVPYSDRDTEWSDWLTVETPFVADVDLPEHIQNWLQQLDTAKQAALAPILDDLRELVDGLAQDVNGLVSVVDQYIQNSIVNYIGNANANITEVRTIAEGLADLYVGVFAGNNVAAANALFRMSASVQEDGAGATVDFEVKANFAAALVKAGLRIGAVSTDEGGEGFVEVTGNKFFFRNTETNEQLPLHMVAIQDSPITLEIEDGQVWADLSTRRRKFRVLVDQNCHIAWPDGVRDSDDWDLMMEFTGDHDVTFDDRYLTPHPIIDADDNSIIVLSFRAQRTFAGTLVAMILSQNSANITPPEQNLWSMISDIGATGSARFTYDMASELCYDPGVDTVQIRDLSGNENHFRFGNQNNSNNQPTFFGTPGGLSTAEYFGPNGPTDRVYISPYQGVDEQTWADEYHCNNTRWTAFGVIRAGTTDNYSSDGPASRGYMAGSNLDGGTSNVRLRKLVPVFSTAAFFAPYVRGVQVALGASPHSGSTPSDFCLRIVVTKHGSGAQPTYRVCQLDETFSIPANMLGQDVFWAIAIDEAAGPNGLTMMINDQVAYRNANYVNTPTSNPPYLHRYRIGRLGGPNDSAYVMPDMNPGSRIYMGHFANRRWSESELLAIRQKIIDVRGFSGI